VVVAYKIHFFFGLFEARAFLAQESEWKMCV